MAADNSVLSSLALKLRQGDGKAFEEIYNLTREPAYFTALKISKNEDDAEDILQESYVHLLEKIGSLENPDVFQSWFNQIVANKAKDFLRKKHPERYTNAYFEDDDGEEKFKGDLIEEDNEEFIPESALENTELQKAVMDMIDSLSDDKRTAVILYYYDNMTTKEIAESLGVNENTVKSRIVQAKKDLAKSVTEYEKKHGKLLGVAPMPLVVWALKAAAASAASSSVASGAAAATLATVSAGTAVAGAAAGTAAGVTAGAGIATKIIAGVVAAAIVGGGAIAGTKAAIDNRKKNQPQQTTSVSASAENKSANSNDRIKKSDDDSNFIGETLTVPDGENVNVRPNIVRSRYGVRFSSMDYARNTADGADTYYGRPVADRSGFSASYSDMLPYAKENMQTYSGEISSTVSQANNIRNTAGENRLVNDGRLAEQAAVRAEEIAWSGRRNSIRPDGSSYTSVFDRNGYTSGTRLEIRAFGKSADEIAGVLAASDDLKNPDIDKIGVGVAENPETGILTFVIHLYSDKGNAGGEADLKEKLDDKKIDAIDEAQKALADYSEFGNRLTEVVEDIPILGPILTTDGPLDVLDMKFHEWFDEWWAEKMEQKELN